MNPFFFFFFALCSLFSVAWSLFYDLISLTLFNPRSVCCPLELSLCRVLEMFHSPDSFSSPIVIMAGNKPALSNPEESKPLNRKIGKWHWIMSYIFSSSFCFTSSFVFLTTFFFFCTSWLVCKMRYFNKSFEFNAQTGTNIHFFQSIPSLCVYVYITFFFFFYTHWT